MNDGGDGTPAQAAATVLVIDDDEAMRRLITRIHG